MLDTRSCSVCSHEWVLKVAGQRPRRCPFCRSMKWEGGNEGRPERKNEGSGTAVASVRLPIVKRDAPVVAVEIPVKRKINLADLMP